MRFDSPNYRENFAVAGLHILIIFFIVVVIPLMIFLYLYYFDPIFGSISIYNGSLVVPIFYTILFGIIHSAVILVLIDLMAALLGSNATINKFKELLHQDEDVDASTLRDCYAQMFKSLDNELIFNWMPLYGTLSVIYLVEIGLRGVSIIVVHNSSYSKYQYVGGFIFLGLAAISSAMLFYVVFIINSASADIFEIACWKNKGSLAIGSRTRYDLLHLFQNCPYEMMILPSVRLSNYNLIIFYRLVIALYISVLIRIAISVN